MAVNDDFLAYVSDLFMPFGNVRSRKMFGGAGIYLDDYFIAILDDDTLYLKADTLTQNRFEAEGLEAFRPYGESGQTMAYYQIPIDWIEDRTRAADWITLARDAAVRAAAKKKRKNR